MFEKYRFGRSVNGEVENEKNRRGRCERSSARRRPNWERSGRQAGLLDGDLAKDITVIENPEIVFKSGVGYDSNAIYESLPRAGWTAVTD
jgi:hypothetical protein